MIDDILEMKGATISQCNATKCLGVMLDSDMSCSSHIHLARAKVSGIGISSKTKKILKLPTLVTLCYSFIYPHLIYCIEVCI